MYNSQFSTRSTKNLFSKRLLFIYPIIMVSAHYLGKTNVFMEKVKLELLHKKSSWDCGPALVSFIRGEHDEIPDNEKVFLLKKFLY